MLLIWPTKGCVAKFPHPQLWTKFHPASIRVEDLAVRVRSFEGSSLLFRLRKTFFQRQYIKDVNQMCKFPSGFHVVSNTWHLQCVYISVKQVALPGGAVSAPAVASTAVVPDKPATSTAEPGPQPQQQKKKEKKPGPKGQSRFVQSAKCLGLWGQICFLEHDPFFPFRVHVKNCEPPDWKRYLSSSKVFYSWRE